MLVPTGILRCPEAGIECGGDVIDQSSRLALSFSQMLRCVDAELKLVIPGNYDLEVDNSYWQAQRDDEDNPEDPDDHDLAVEAMTGPLAGEAGV